MKGSIGALLLAIAGCDDARPEAQAAFSSQAAAGTSPRVATATGSAIKIDSPPAAVAPEHRLKQRQVGAHLVIDSNGRWARDCAIHRACRITPQAPKLCAPERDAESWSPQLASRAEHFTDPRVAIKGTLVMSDGAFSTAVACAKGQCCNGRSAAMVLAGPPYDLELVGLGCAGDESRLCCATSARGEEVVASGRLTYETGRLRLESPELCRTQASPKLSTP